MIKKIKIKDLTTGMWVERFPGSWIERPFWKQSFLLTDLKDLQTIRKSGIPFLWINTEKGRQETTDNSVTAKSTPEVIVDIQREPRALSAEEVMELERESVENEIERAYLLCEEAREAVSAMFGMSYFGRVIDIEDARKIVEKLFQSLERNRDAILSIAILKSEMEYTYSRSITVCGLMIALGFSLDLEKEQIVGR